MRVAQVKRFVVSDHPLPWLLPLVAILLVFTVYPLIYNIWLSFHEYVPRKRALEYVGTQNWVQLWNDARFWQSLTITFIYFAVALAFELVLGMAIALLLDNDGFGFGFLRGVLTMTLVIPPAIAGMMFLLMQDPQFGVISYFLQWIGLLDPARPILATASTALAGVLLPEIWQWTPFMVLIFLAGLRALPREPYEAAMIDGASSLQIFRRITLPMMAKVIAIAVLIRGIDLFRGFGERGSAILALRDGFYAFDFKTGTAERIVETQPGELRPRLNDGKVDRQGRFVAGSMDFQESEPVGKLFRLDPDLSLHVLDSGIICSNGPCFSPDGETLYFADSFKKTIYAYAYDPATGSVRSRRVFTTFEGLRGYPDGATVDAEGYVWSVEVYSGRLIRCDPSGVIDRIIGLPVNSTTSISFGGPDLDIAYVTSMARPHANAYHREREAGFVFAVHGLGVRGIEEPRFRG